MRTRLMTSMLSAWAMAITYDQIEVTTGVEVKVLLYAAIVTMIFGLYLGLKKEG